MTPRDSLISAAAKLLDRGGLAAVTLREVGRVAGVSRTAPYRHFADKNDLLAAIAGRELRRQIVSVSGDAGAPPTARSLMLAHVRWARRYPERFKLTFGRWARGNAEFDEAAILARTTMVAAVAAAQAKGELPAGDSERVAALILALAHGAADLALAGHLSANGRGRAEPEDLVDDLFRYLKNR